MTRSGRFGGNDEEGTSQVVDESTRLLPSSESESESEPEPVAGTQPLTTSESRIPTLRTPLPVAQLTSLIFIRIADPIAYHQIFPYINTLLSELGVGMDVGVGVGVYSGFIESAYSLAQVVSVYQWGRISDIVGRRPVVLVGLLGMAFTTTAFGLSKSLLGIIVWRFLGGFLAGNTAVIHSILAEITDETNQDLAVPIYSLSWPIGTIIGPLIGGTLGNAATRYPEFFGWGVFVEYPYLLACVVSAGFALLGAGLGFALIEETLPSKRKRTTGTSSAPASTPGEDPNQGQGMSVRELWSVPAIRALAISGFALSGLSLAFDVVVALFCCTAVESGGLGMEPSTIGNFLAFAGVLAVLLRFFVMPYILRTFDYAKTYNACMMLWPIAFAGLPILNFIARYHSLALGPVTGMETTATEKADAHTTAAIWIGLATLLALSKAAVIAYSLSMLLIKRHSPTPSSLGQSNGIVQFAMSVGRAVGPVVVSTLFTVCNGSEWMRRWGMEWVWAGMMVGLSVVGARVTKGIGSG